MYPAYIHTAKTARNIDTAAIQTYKIPSLVLMEHAAIECVNEIEKRFDKKHNFTILCGPGNNGGDGLAIARLLHQKGYSVFIYVVKENSMSKDEKIQFEIIKNLNIPYAQEIPNTFGDIIIDAIFGNGLSRDITGDLKEWIQKANQSKKTIISIDVPSGIDATTGEIKGIAIQSNLNISLDCYKAGTWLNSGKQHIRENILVDISIPRCLHTRCVDPTQVVQKNLIHLPKRAHTAHKGSFGKALMIGGSKSMHGAIAMAANSCYRSGIGTLTLMVPESIGDILAFKADYYMLLRSPEHNGVFSSKALDLLKQNCQNYSLITIGNGMQQNQITIQMVDYLLQTSKPLILDADAIWACGQCLDHLNRDYLTILTPHIKEMTYLTNQTIEEILKNPIESARSFTKQYKNCILVLKSSCTYIAYHNEVYVLEGNNPALAKGGSGDILCGIMTAMLGQAKNGLQAALCATYIHQKSALLNKDSASVLPNDIIDHIPQTIKEMR